MKHPELSQIQNVLLMLVGPVLLVTIYFAASHVLSTYNKLEYQRQESIWSFFQLSKELENAYFNSERYLHDMIDEKPMRTSYDVLWSRTDVALNSVRKDKTFTLLRDNTIEPSLLDLFKHIKSIETEMSQTGPISEPLLNRWAVRIREFEARINMNLIHNIASTQSDYSKKSAFLLLEAIFILMFFILCFIFYLGYLLIALWRERRRNQHLLDHDSLTGLHSRDYTMHLLKQYCQQAKPFALMSIDLNKFKIVNDTLGHHAGDQLLQYLGKQFTATLAKHGTIGRIGGDEFLWVCPSPNRQQVNEFYQQLLDALQKPCLIGEKSIYLHLSTGGCLAADYEFHCTYLMEKVDHAMYQAKKQQLKDIYWGKLSNPTVKQLKSVAIPLPA